MLSAIMLLWIVLEVSATWGQVSRHNVDCGGTVTSVATDSVEVEVDSGDVSLAINLIFHQSARVLCSRGRPSRPQV